jgi:hypothetical protein
MQIASPITCFNLENNNLHVCSAVVIDAKTTTAVLLGMFLLEEPKSHHPFKHMLISIEILELLIIYTITRVLDQNRSQ